MNCRHGGCGRAARSSTSRTVRLPSQRREVGGKNLLIIIERRAKGGRGENKKEKGPGFIGFAVCWWVARCSGFRVSVKPGPLNCTVHRAPGTGVGVVALENKE